MQVSGSFGALFEDAEHRAMISLAVRLRLPFLTRNISTSGSTALTDFDILLKMASFFTCSE